jgi:capsular polysaccharide biosynthesis protein
VPYEPRRTRGLSFLAVGLLLSALFSLVAALVADVVTPKVHTPSDLESVLGVPVLAWIPATRR